MTNDAKETATWTIDLKKTATVYKGKAKPKADITIIFTDTTLTDIASGKVRTRFAATLPLPSCLWMTWKLMKFHLSTAKRPESVHDRQAQDEG